MMVVRQNHRYMSFSLPAISGGSGSGANIRSFLHSFARSFVHSFRSLVRSLARSASSYIPSYRVWLRGELPQFTPSSIYFYPHSSPPASELESWICKSRIFLGGAAGLRPAARKRENCGQIFWRVGHKQSKAKREK